MNTKLLETKIQQKTFKNRGINLSYFDIGKGEPVILLHGFTMNAKANWLDTGWVKSLVNSGYRVIALDACGHGESDKPYSEEFYPSNIMAGDSIELMNLLNIESASFIGFSMGARMATFNAINHPERVKKLVIGGMGINLIKGLNNTDIISQGLLAKNISEITDRNARRFRRLSETRGNDLKAMAYCINSSRQKITIEELQKITAKTLIIAGTDDEVAGSTFELRFYINNSIARAIKDCNHFNALTHPTFRCRAIRHITLNEFCNSEKTY